MNLKSKLTQKVIIVLAAVSLCAFSLISYSVGSKSTENAKCNYSQERYDVLSEKFNLPLAVVHPPITEENMVKIEALEGECGDFALKRVYELGARNLRDLSDCWNECIVTDDFNLNRVNIAVKNKVVVSIYLG